MKRKRSVSTMGGTDRISFQKSLSTFIEEKENEKDKGEYDDISIIGEKTEDIGIEGNKEIEIKEEIVADKVIEKRLPSQIETDYYEKSRIDSCAKRLRELFNIDIDIFPVRYGSKPPLNQKIYGYYMLIKVKDKGYDHIVDFIRNDCGLKVYTSTTPS